MSKFRIPNAKVSNKVVTVSEASADPNQSFTCGTCGRPLVYARASGPGKKFTPAHFRHTEKRGCPLEA